MTRRTKISNLAPAGVSGSALLGFPTLLRAHLCNVIRVPEDVAGCDGLFREHAFCSCEVLAERLFGGRAEVGGSPMYSTKQAVAEMSVEIGLAKEYSAPFGGCQEWTSRVWSRALVGLGSNQALSRKSNPWNGELSCSILLAGVRLRWVKCCHGGFIRLA